MPKSSDSSLSPSKPNWQELLKYVDYKSPELKTELLNPLTSERLRVLVVAVSSMTRTMFGKNIIITRVWWHEGQEAHPDSAHRLERWGICRACDIRANFDYFSTVELKQIELFVQKGFPRQDGLPTIKIHGEGVKYHVHLQIEK